MVSCEDLKMAVMSSFFLFMVGIKVLHVFSDYLCTALYIYIAFRNFEYGCIAVRHVDYFCLCLHSS